MKQIGNILQTAVLLLTVTTAFAAPLLAPPPAAKDKCPVCGMFVAKYPDWVVVATFKDSTSLYFDGAKDFFTYYHNMKKYTPAKNQSSISSVTVKDYYHLKQIDAFKSSFVIGSDVYGPMGKELVPFEKPTDAQAFQKDHMGKRILQFKDVTPAVLKTLE